MQDLSVNTLADEIRDELISQGISLPRRHVRALVRRFFRYAEKTAQTPNLRLNFRTRDINYIYPIFDAKKLCEEFATGEPGMVSAQYLLRKRKLSKRVLKHMHRQKMYLEEEIE
jgi:hypothetical protein